MFDLEALSAVDPHADEAALIEQIAWLEQVKSAAAAGQARDGRTGSEASSRRGRRRSTQDETGSRGGQ
jgi:hypothetical protein